MKRKRQPQYDLDPSNRRQFVKTMGVTTVGALALPAWAEDASDVKVAQAANLTMNIGPRGDGSIHTDGVKALTDVGKLFREKGWPPLKNCPE